MVAHTACEKSNLGWPTSFFLSYLVIFGVVFFPPQRLQAGETTRIPQRHCRLAHGVSQCFIYDSIHPSLLALCVVVFMQRNRGHTAPMAFFFPVPRVGCNFRHTFIRLSFFVLLNFSSSIIFSVCVYFCPLPRRRSFHIGKTGSLPVQQRLLHKLCGDIF